MNKQLLGLLRDLPRWRIIFLIVLAGGLAMLTFLLLENIITSILYNSLVFTNTRNAFIDIVGPRKWDRLLQVVEPVVYLVLWMMLTLLYLYLFYRRERRAYYDRCVSRLIQDVAFIAEGNFNDRLKEMPFQDLALLSDHIMIVVDRLKQSMKEELQAEMTKNELITNVSHDLRTPMTSILGYLSLIENDKYKDEVELRYYTQIVYARASALNNLIHDLFEYTKLRNKTVSLEKIPINMVEMLSQMEQQFRLELERSGVECRQFYSTEEKYVLGDSNKLARVFENLFSNAIHYGKDGKYLDIFLKDEDDTLIIDIVNYGDPIPAIDLPHIFDRFYRVEKSRSAETGGSGLGLAIAKDIIELHQGTIDVSSSSEKTCFTVQLQLLNKQS
ncbi:MULTISPECIES: cell wall metabolism sensor histidine kinase WalK [Paenibacillus]|uniref:histidine kinase n=1 Tax=Paenibacillus campinasensis TaxID=66347 RepID=A0ABW9T4T5_9BACL|nr:MULTISPECIES: HAMP domain-containing sensor histidine kinase [Paenibacillus]MUG67882.1 GHKL domain-containing protein [Paenibacillus campinasensis]PAK47938.1 two-component sensor histidine kinase [Paenibacillus sp. 7541]